MKRFAALLFLVTFSSVGWAAPECKGKFFNPFTDVCWSCVFPFTIGGQDIAVNGQESKPTYDGNFFCACTDTNPPRVGFTMGFWEPARIAEVSRGAFCFHALGGISADPGIDVPSHSQNSTSSGVNHSFYQMHWYAAPLLFWLEVLFDTACLEQGVFDLAYLTEVDPTWADSELTFILNPDIALFANPVAQTACAADCVAANFGFSRNELYWCAGCNGPMYPLTGFVSSHNGGVQASALLVQRLTNKLHRELLMWGASGSGGLCGFYPQPLMDKTNYKYQLIYPTPQTEKVNGRCCQPYGRSTMIYGAGKEVPYVGEDFAFQIFRKRDCCTGYSVGD